MSSKGYTDDASAILYLVPFIASGAYAIFLWAVGGITNAVLPSSVYLTVTRDPVVFLVGTLSVLLGVVIEVRSSDTSGKSAKLTSVGNTMQSIAAASLLLALLSAWYANGFSDVSGAATDFIVGRFSLVFPVMLVILSYLITARFDLRSLRNPKALGILVLLLVPVSIYEVGKRNDFLGLGGAFLLLIVGVALLLRSTRNLPETAKSGAG